MPTETNIPVKCLHCHAELTTPLICAECRTLFPPSPSTNYFELLGLPQSYAVDQTRLQQAFKEAVRNIHPDRFVDDSEATRVLATRLSADINKSFDVLSDPVQRAAYLLELAGGPSAAEVREVPGDLLAEVMTLREEIEEGLEAKNAKALDGFRERVQSKHGDALRRIGEFADTLDTSSADDKMALRKLLNSIKYYDNLLELLATDPLADGEPQA